MARIFDLHGLASLTVDDDRERVLQYVDAQLDPYQPSAGVDPETTDVVLCPNNGIVAGSFCDVHGPAGDNRRTCVVDGRCYLMRSDSLFELPRLSTEIEQVRLSYDRTFPLWVGFSEVVRPLLQLATINRGAVVVHGAAVQLRGGGLVVCGWSETGKTETALALAEAGARFISDKWTVIDNNARIHAFPVSVGIRDWVLDYLPRLRAHLPASQRARLRAARTARRGLPLLIKAGANPLSAAAESQLEHALTLAGRVSLRQTDVAAVYGSPQDPAATPPLVTLAMLTTVPGQEVTVREADVGWAARRLAQSAVYERRSLYELDARVRYAFAQSGPSPLLRVADREADLLRNLLAGVRLLEVKAPFPTDPRKVADALARWC
ncbi:MAG: hypothetical protein JO057_25255 [Chloroflexi bacterium]|nr:hypothetical protein [Chloroflexota bacterium]MBV9803341.1 hypothetical protein [Solirubrobacterales bacterium]